MQQQDLVRMIYIFSFKDKQRGRINLFGWTACVYIYMTYMEMLFRFQSSCRGLGFVICMHIYICLQFRKETKRCLLLVLSVARVVVENGAIR